MRIAIVTGRFPALSELFIRREAQALVRQGHTVLLWPCEAPLPQARWTAPDDTPLPPVLQRRNGATGLILRRLREAGMLQWRRLPAVWRARALLPWTPEIVCAQFASLPAVIGNALAASFGRPWSLAIHARDVWVPWTPGLRAADSAAAVFACNRAAQQQWEALRPAWCNRTTLLYHGLDLASWTPPATKQGQASPRIDLFAAGRLVRKKGFDILLEALARLRPRHPDLHCVLAGDGPERLPLEQQADRLGLRTPASGSDHPAVRFSDWLPPLALRETLRSARIVVQPGRIDRDGDRDGIPNLVLEALACARPVVATTVGGLPEAVRDGETGWQVDPESPQALADGIADALRDPEEQTRRGEAGRRLIAEAFDIDANARRLGAKLNDIVERWDATAAIPGSPATA